MNNASIITQLEKALKSKDDKELRLRVEVLLDILKEEPQRPTYIPQPMPTNPIPQPAVSYDVSDKPMKIAGPGAIISKGEQINYTRPKGT